MVIFQAKLHNFHSTRVRLNKETKLTIVNRPSHNNGPSLRACAHYEERSMFALSVVSINI